MHTHLAPGAALGSSGAVLLQCRLGVVEGWKGLLWFRRPDFEETPSLRWPGFPLRHGDTCTPALQVKVGDTAPARFMSAQMTSKKGQANGTSRTEVLLTVTVLELLGWRRVTSTRVPGAS